MTAILEHNAEEHWVRVQPGVIKDDLNSRIKSTGYFFSPDLSTSNRATIGGMISTDASGQEQGATAAPQGMCSPYRSC